MAVPKWLDRLWLIAIALSALLMVPLWLSMAVEDFGLPVVLLFLLVFAFSFWRHRTR